MSDEMINDEVIEEQAAAPSRYEAVAADSHGQIILHPSREEYRNLVQAAFDDGFEMCSDVCAIDYLNQMDRVLPPGITAERFEVVTNLLSLSKRERIRIRVQVPASDPTCSSIVGIYPGAEAMEREAFDLLGVLFEGHPDLTRILMPEDWEGHPLRKDYGSSRIPVQFKHPEGAH